MTRQLVPVLPGEVSHILDFPGPPGGPSRNRLAGRTVVCLQELADHRAGMSLRRGTWHVQARFGSTSNQRAECVALDLCESRRCWPGRT